MIGRRLAASSASGSLNQEWGSVPTQVYNPSTERFFGESVATCDKYTVVGAPYDATSGGVAYIFRNADGALLHTLANPNNYDVATSDQFGFSVGICDEYTIVGANQEDNVTFTGTGIAYVFDNTDGTLLYTLDNPDPVTSTNDDRFGSAVGITSTHAIVGSPREDVSGAVTLSGAAYIFGMSDGLLDHTLTNPNAYSTATNDEFGNAVAISDTYVIVGAYAEDVVPNNTGIAYVFDVATGTLQHTLTHPSPGSGDEFGTSVAICDEYSVVGCPLDDDPAGNSGSVFTFDNITGSLRSTIRNPNVESTENTDQFGYSVGVSPDGNYLIVGAPSEVRIVDGTTQNAGAAYIFSKTGQVLQSFANPHPINLLGLDSGIEDNLGWSVSISNEYACVGFPDMDSFDDLTSQEGSVHIFKRSLLESPLNTAIHKDGYDTPIGDAYGERIATCNRYTIVGAYAEDEVGETISGAVFIYRNLDGALLYTITNQNAYSTATNDRFGWSVGICDSYAIVGAPFEDSAAGSEEGKAYVYDMNDGTLLYTLTNPDYSSAPAGDRFGFAVDITDSYAVVGAYETDGVSTGGVAYIFGMSDGLLDHTLVNPSLSPTFDGFAREVAISETYTVCGARSDDDAGTSGDGAIYIFDNATGTLQHTVLNPNNTGVATNDYFGDRVAICELYTAAAATQEDTNGIDSGVVYIIDNSTGSVIQTITNPNADELSTGDDFGNGLSITDDYLLVGAPTETENDGAITSAGKAYLYETTYWNLLRTFDNPNIESTSVSDSFGFSVGISDKYLAISATGEHVNDGTTIYAGGGALYIYPVGTTHVPLHVLENPNPFGTADSDQFGYAVASCDMFTLVGVPSEDESGNLGSGKAYLYRNSDKTLMHTFNNPNGYDTAANDQFGWNVDVTDSYSIVSAPSEDEASGTGSGKVYIFNNTNGNLLYTLDNPNSSGTVTNDQFGLEVAICENYAAVAAYKENSNSGVVYIYGMSDGILDWTVTNPNPEATASDDRFGYSIGISNDYTVASAPYEDESGVITSSGKVYMIDNTTGTVTYTLNNPNDYDTASADFFGWSVDISDDYVAVGAPFEDTATNSDTGKVYVFDNTGSLVHTLDNPNGATDDEFGTYVNVSDDYTIVGSYNNEAYLFSNTSGVLQTTLTNPDINSTTSDSFGSSVSVSGRYVSIGAPTENEYDGSTLRTSSGVVYIYDTYTVSNPY